MEAPTIVTRRLRLSPLLPGDAPAFLEYRSDPAACRFQHFVPGSLEEVRGFIEELQGISFDQPGTWFQLGIRMLGAGALVGDVGIHFPVQDARQAEIGFTLAPKHQGCGFGTEAVTGVLSCLLGTLGKHRVIASVDPRNERSIALLRRVGMRQEAHFRQSLWFKGEWADDLVFAILESEWGTRRVDEVPSSA
jgi:RimJ/RimL family protein N-acetyltransferase